MEINDLISLLEYCSKNKECRACPMDAVKGCTEELMWNAIIFLRKLLAENQQLRNDLIMQTALAQNGQSAIETNRRLRQEVATLKSERDAALEE